ncbi:MAG: SpoIIIAH-like family protein [Clostridia bacterium]|nr:SpoIIIAH-like family protein [Clostridia bacterium]
MSKKKKIIILSCMVALLAVTAVFNFVLSTGKVGSNEDVVLTSASNYFTQYRTERLNTRNEEIMQLDAVIASASTDSDVMGEALAMKVDLTANTEKELLLENLIKAYGFEDAVVVIGLDSDNVNVIAKSTDLTADDAVAIYTIISEEINISPENVKIIPIS